MTQSKTPFIVVLSLALTMMLGPFSMDTYLPAFPVIGESLGVSQQAVSLSVSVYVFAMAFGQLIGGALSDRFGRQRVLMSGLAIFALSSIVIGMADSLNTLLVGRAVQALGAGFTLVSVPALVRDRVAGRDAAKLFSMMGFIMVLAPGIAPSVGSAILALGSWHYIFFALAVYAVLLVPLLVRVLFTGTGKVSRAKSPKMSLLARYKLVLSTKPALPFIVWQAASFSTLMMFITYASFIYQGHFGQSPSAFSMLFAANIVAMLIFNILNRVLLSRLSSLRILQLATGNGLSGRWHTVVGDGGFYGVAAVRFLARHDADHRCGRGDLAEYSGLLFGVLSHQWRDGRSASGCGPVRCCRAAERTVCHVAAYA
ncbi:MFS transporter [Halomonas sp. N3-2A]|uniref:MFS transporter n=1 Tax=Halomonas sp. N3-2A TaxID=2014541 RepID=UPI001E391CFD|nr:MFS transporter [Halomonas sp. N3-2A]